MTQPIASFSGIASGIQWRDMVDQIMAAERRPVARLESQLQLIQRRVASWRAIQTSVTGLRDTLKPLADGTAFGRFTTSLSGVTQGEQPPVAVTASGSATTGSFRIEVVAVAQHAKLGTSAFASRSEALGMSGSLSLNGTTVEIGENDSLNDIVAGINAANRGTTATGVSASIVRTPDGEHRLVLTADRTGAAGITVADDTSGLLAGAAFIAEGRDAELRIDGELHRNATNTFADIVDGVTFTVARVTTNPIDARVSRDVAATRTAVRALVDSYNALAEAVKQQSNSAAKAALAGNSTVRGMQSTLRASLDAELEGAAAELSRLADLGIQVDRSGRYTFDAKTFDEKFAASPAAVASLVGGIATSTQQLADGFLTGTSGSIPSIIADMEAGMPRINARIEVLEDRLDRRRDDMYRRFTRMEQALSKAQTQSQWLASQLAQFEPSRR